MPKISVPTSKTRLADYDQSIGQVLVERTKLEQNKNPDVELGDFVVLKEGPRSYKCASHWIIVDRNTGERHHHAVTIETYLRYKAGWQWDEEHSITLEDTNKNEVQTLATFLYAVTGQDFPSSPGQYLITPVDGEYISGSSIHQILTLVSSNSKADFVLEALALAKNDPEILHALMNKAAANTQVTKDAAATLNAVSFKLALDELIDLIDSNALESKYQALLSENAWMFGSEYSELLSKRDWSRAQSQDFMLRCTTDRYLEIIEIKTTLEGKPLFLPDPSHNTFYPRRELSAVLGQVMHYLETLDSDRHMIKSQDGEDVSKIRAKIIIGRDGDDDQRAALRRLNGHLHRVEIITFDQLAATAAQVLKYLTDNSS